MAVINEMKNSAASSGVSHTLRTCLRVVERKFILLAGVIPNLRMQHNLYSQKKFNHSKIQGMNLRLPITGVLHKIGAKLYPNYLGKGEGAYVARAYSRLKVHF
jgi:hypothetical protein